MSARRSGALLFGPAGVPLSSRAPSLAAGLQRVAELGLQCMELEFVRGVHMSEAAAYAVRDIATRTHLGLSAHAPYFINLNAHETAKLRASKQRILQTARIAAICGAQSIVFHPAYYLDDAPTQVYAHVKEHLNDILDQLRREGNNVTMRPELMGKRSQFGDLEELLRLCEEIEGLQPCIDFAHLHARTGAMNSYREFVGVLDQIEKRLGRQALDKIHIHLSGISYGKAGERKHLMLGESDLDYRELLRALKDRQVKGMVISESPLMEEDAQLLQAFYRSL